MGQFIESLDVAPDNLYQRLEQAYRQEPLTVVIELQALVRGTVDLVEQHMPEVDTSKVRLALDRQEHTWNVTFAP